MHSGIHGVMLEINHGMLAGLHGIAQRCSDCASTVVGKLPGRVNKARLQFGADDLASRHEVATKFTGSTGVYLNTQSERMPTPDGRYTPGQLLCSLYKRGDRWAGELDDSDLTCTVNGQDAKLFDTIEPGAELCISSKKSISEE